MKGLQERTGQDCAISICHSQGQVVNCFQIESGSGNMEGTLGIWLGGIGDHQLGSESMEHTSPGTAVGNVSIRERLRGRRSTVDRQLSCETQHARARYATIHHAIAMTSNSTAQHCNSTVQYSTVL